MHLIFISGYLCNTTTMKQTILLIIFTLIISSARGQKPADSAYISKTRQLLIRLQNAKYDEAVTYFDASVSDKLNAGMLQKAWSQITGKIGDVQSTGIPRTEESGSYKIVYLPCVFEKLTLDLKVSFLDNLKAVGFFMVPHTETTSYELPPYADVANIQELRIMVRTGKYKLQGIFLAPKNTVKKYPVVILVHGSGPNDMDESFNGNKPFKDIAYGLAAKGIAVIRYDKRTKVYANEMAEKVNVTLEEETIQDAISAIKLAKKMPGVDTTRIYVLGHSLGAMAAPRIAMYEHDLAGIILMAGPARPFEDVVLEQVEYLNSLNPSVKKEKELEDFKNKVNKVKSGEMSPKTPSEQLPLGLSANYWLYLNEYHQAEEIKKLEIPILILQGERDYQVSMQDFALWKKALKQNKKAELKSYPQLNHLFLEGEGKKSTPSEYNIPSHIPAYVIDDITTFITRGTE
jgi:uncharacterized protein